MLATASLPDYGCSSDGEKFGANVGVVIYATRLLPPGEFALWCRRALVFSGLLGARMAPTAFDAVALHVDDGAVLCLRLGDGDHGSDSVLSAIAEWWEHEPANAHAMPSTVPNG